MEFINDLVTFRERTHPIFFPPAYINAVYTTKCAWNDFGYGMTSFVAIFRDNMRQMSNATKEDDNILKSKLFQKIIDDPNFIRESGSKFQANAAKLITFCKTEKRIKNPSKRRLIRLLNKYLKLYIGTCYWVACHMFWSVESLMEHLNNEMEKFVKDKDKRREYIEILSTPTRKTYVFEQELCLLQIINNLDKELRELIVNENYINLLISIIKLKYPCVYNKLVNHANRFGFIPYDYIGPDYWGVKEIIKDIQKQLKENNVAKRLKELGCFHENLKKKQDKIIKKLNLNNELIRLFLDLQIIADMQDKRKKYCIMSHIYLNKYLLRNISLQTSIPIELLRLMGVHEIRSLLQGKKFELDELYKRRIKSIMYLGRNSFNVYTGLEADKILSKLDDEDLDKKIIKGVPASKGKVKGNVTILMSARELDKIKQGDIIVTPMTTPDFIPAMKKASAIITNEGGITCHAAIVSRELGIPCVIGTKNATKILKDGDLVEVDADKGIVKILK